LLFTDIGYGNYVLTAPVERSRRNSDKPDSEKPKEPSGRFDVPELLSPSNTLTNPNAKKTKIEL
jgi:hypothetical protein